MQQKLKAAVLALFFNSVKRELRMKIKKGQLLSTLNFPGVGIPTGFGAHKGCVTITKKDLKPGTGEVPADIISCCW